MELIAYTDGSCTPNPGCGGWGWILLHKDKELERRYGGVLSSTSVKMEMTALLELFDYLVFCKYSNTNIKVYCDNDMCCKGLVDKGKGSLTSPGVYTGWMKSWKAGGWKKKPDKNKELWQKMDTAIQHFLKNNNTIYIQHINSHSDIKWNDEVDDLAKKGGREMKTIFHSEV